MRLLFRTFDFPRPTPSFAQHDSFRERTSLESTHDQWISARLEKNHNTFCIASASSTWTLAAGHQLFLALRIPFQRTRGTKRSSVAQTGLLNLLYVCRPNMWPQSCMHAAFAECLHDRFARPSTPYEVRAERKEKACVQGNEKLACTYQCSRAPLPFLCCRKRIDLT